MSYTDKLNKIFNSGRGVEHWEVLSNPFKPLVVTLSPEESLSLNAIGVTAVDLCSPLDDVVWEYREVFVCVPGGIHLPDRAEIRAVVSQFCSSLEGSTPYLINLPCKMTGETIGVDTLIQEFGGGAWAKLRATYRPALVKAGRGAALNSDVKEGDKLVIAAIALSHSLMFSESFGWIIKSRGVWRAATPEVAHRAIFDAYTAQGWKINNSNELGFINRLLPALLLSEATPSFFQHQLIRQFIFERYNGKHSEISHLIRKEYEKWCAINFISPLDPRIFWRHMEEVGCSRVLNAEGRPVRPHNFFRYSFPHLKH